MANRLGPTKQEFESPVSFSMRVMSWSAWWEAHDMFCDFAPDCLMHSSPYEDGSVELSDRDDRG